MKKLSKEQILMLHTQLIQQTGGSDGVRDYNLLDSALETPFQSFGGDELYPTIQAKAARLGYVGNYTRLGNSCWFTSIEHGRRHEPLSLMSMADNLRFSKHKELRGKAAYDRYDNYDAIEVPFTDAIPSDYEGVMGVPISFLIKYCPEQFEILGITDRQNTSCLRTKKYTNVDSQNTTT